MGADYYHEAVAEPRDEENIELSDENGFVKLEVLVEDEDGEEYMDEEVHIEVPVGGKVYVDPQTSENVWTR